MIGLLKILISIIALIIFFDVFLKIYLFLKINSDKKFNNKLKLMNNFPLVNLDKSLNNNYFSDKYDCNKDFFQIEQNNYNCDFCDENYFLKVVLEDNVYIINGLILTKGNYCIKKHFEEVFKNNSSILTSQGWKNLSFSDISLTTNLMCKNLNIKDKENQNNFLFDFFLNKKVTKPLEENSNIYEKFNDNYRYRCKCLGKDLLGNSLIEHNKLPHLCFKNFCNTIKNGSSFLDLDLGFCNCGNRGFNIENNPRFKCISSKFKLNLKENNLNGYFRCFTKFSSIKEVEKLTICNHEQFENSNYGITKFNVNLNSSNDHLHFSDY